MFHRYNLKNPILAVKYDGYNGEQLIKIFNEAYPLSLEFPFTLKLKGQSDDKSYGRHLHLVILSLHKEEDFINLTAGKWIIISPDGEITVLEDEEFHGKYTEVLPF